MYAVILLGWNWDEIRWSTDFALIEHRRKSQQFYGDMPLAWVMLSAMLLIHVIALSRRRAQP
jgi:hypothetical protein